MNDRLIQLLQRLTPEEEAEVETLAAAIVARRDSQNPQLQSDDISRFGRVGPIGVDSGGFDWLEASEEDVYSLSDGRAVQWNACSSNPGQHSPGALPLYRLDLL